MIELRRKLLRGGTAAALLAPWLGTALLVPGRVLADEWNRAAFTARTLGEALRAHGAAAATESRDVIVVGPEIAENGAKVEVEITSQIPGTRSIAVFADRNPMPLCAVIDFAEAALPYCRLQLKLAETTRIRAVVKAGDGKSHVAFREIRVTLGGCGG